jgi:hypothetical protein
MRPVSNSFKIRALLFLLTLSFVGTAITIDLTLHDIDLLKSDALKIEWIWMTINDRNIGINNFN